MSGGHSLHGKDWLKIAGGAALAATGLGAAGIGPLAGLLGTSAAAPAAGVGAVDALGPGLGAPLAAGFGPTAGGSSIVGAASIPSITPEAASGLGGGTSSLFGGGASPALAASPQPMMTAALGTGSGGISAPTFADKAGAFFSPDGGQYRWDALKSGMGKVAKAQAAYKLGAGLLGGQPQGGGGGGAQLPASAFGSHASPNLTQFTSSPNSMAMQPQLPPQLAMLPPNDPRVLAYLQQMGGMYG